MQMCKERNIHVREGDSKLVLVNTLKRWMFVRGR